MIRSEDECAVDRLARLRRRGARSTTGESNQSIKSKFLTKPHARANEKPHHSTTIAQGVAHPARESMPSERQWETLDTPDKSSFFFSWTLHNHHLLIPPARHIPTHRNNYMHTHTHVYKYKHIYKHIYKHTHTHTYIYAHI